MTAKVFFLALAIFAAGTVAVILWPLPGAAPVVMEDTDADCSTCTARQRDKQRLRRELEKLSATRD